MNLVQQASRLNRQPVLVNETERGLLLTALFSAGMVLARGLYAGHYAFVFLLWNLFLAYVPYAVSRLMTLYPERVASPFRFGFLLLVWLLFFPNAFYILTDLFHLRGKNETIPIWFDLAMILSFAWNGLMLGVLSLRQVEKLLLARGLIRNEALFAYGIMLLTALGIYIGRYLRFNSWDVVTNPSGLVLQVGDLLLHPLHNRFDWSMILCYSLLMTFFYTMIKRAGRALSAS